MSLAVLLCAETCMRCYMFGALITYQICNTAYICVHLMNSSYSTNSWLRWLATQACPSVWMLEVCTPGRNARPAVSHMHHTAICGTFFACLGTVQMTCTSMTCHSLGVLQTAIENGLGSDIPHTIMSIHALASSATRADAI